MRSLLILIAIKGDCGRMSIASIQKKNQPSRQMRGWFQKRIKPNLLLYVFLIPPLLYAAFLWYAPMFGLVMAFQNFNPGKGFLGSPWVGFAHFERFFGSYMFGTLLKNTLLISLYSFLAGLPFPIILAFAFQYSARRRFAKFVQTATYAPHFISIVVLVGMLTIFLSPRTGFVNMLLQGLGMDPIHFMSEKSMFAHIYVWSGIWQGAGWGSVIYTAALAGSDPALHEAAVIDGASLWKRVIHVDLPVLVPTFIILQIMGIGNILGVGFEKIYLMQNPANIMVSEVISTYTYTLGVKGGEVSYTTAIGMFNNIINFILLLSANFISNRLTKMSVM